MTVIPDVELTGLTPTPAVVEERSVHRDRLGRAIDEATRRVGAAGAPTAGAPSVGDLETGEFSRIEVGLPPDGAHSAPTLRTTVLPGGQAAGVCHVGPFADLGESFPDWRHGSGRADRRRGILGSGTGPRPTPSLLASRSCGQ